MNCSYIFDATDSDMTNTPVPTVSTVGETVDSLLISDDLSVPASAGLIATTSNSQKVYASDIIPVPHIARVGLPQKRKRLVIKGIVNSDENIAILEGEEVKRKPIRPRPNLKPTVKPKSLPKKATKDLKGPKGRPRGKPEATVQAAAGVDNALDAERRANTDNYCGYCDGYYYDDSPDDDQWMNCDTCHKWFHDSCAGNYTRSSLMVKCSMCAKTPTG